MSASKLSEQIAASYCSAIEDGERLLYEPGVVNALDEMALRVFEETRERAAKIAADAIAPNRRDIADAIRAMLPEPGGTK